MIFRFVKACGTGRLWGTFESYAGFTDHMDIFVSQKLPKYTCFVSFILQTLNAISLPIESTIWQDMQFKLDQALLIARFAILQYFFQWNIAFAILSQYCRFLMRNISILFQYCIIFPLQYSQNNFRNFWWICLKFNVITSRFNFYAASYAKILQSFF